MKHISIYILFVLCATIIVLNRFTALYISDYRLHFALLFIAASTFVIIIGHLFKRLRSTKSIVLTFIIVGTLCFVRAFFTWGGDWKTETVIYRNNDDAKRTIDMQLRGDHFAFGYKQRIVEICKLAPGIVWTTDVDTLQLDQLQWHRVDEQVNSLQRL